MGASARLLKIGFWHSQYCQLSFSDGQKVGKSPPFLFNGSLNKYSIGPRPDRSFIHFNHGLNLNNLPVLARARMDGRATDRTTAPARTPRETLCVSKRCIRGILIVMARGRAAVMAGSRLLSVGGGTAKITTSSSIFDYGRPVHPLYHNRGDFRCHH